MHLCICGFANSDEATQCAACGNALVSEASASDLLLEDLRSGEVIHVAAPGGVLGRAGDFAPDSFSPRVSGVHAVVSTNSEGRWTIEHTGRNASSVERGGVWSVLRTGTPQPLFGGETLKLADMVFRVHIDPASHVGSASHTDSVGGDFSRPLSQCSVDGLTQDSAAVGTEGGLTAAPTEVEEASASASWSVRCPVCGTEHAVEEPEARIAMCSFCKDPLDARQIARVAARPIPAA